METEQRGEKEQKEQTQRERSGDAGSMEISEEWFSLRSGCGVQSLGIDLFKIQSSTIDKLRVLKSLSEPTAAHVAHRPV